MRWQRRALSETEAARQSERWGFWALIVGIVAMLVGVGMTVWSVRRSEELTVASGALDKPQPHLYLGDLRIDRPVQVYMAAPFPEKSLALVKIPLRVRNDGSKTTKGIQLLVREPKMIAVDSQSLQAQVDTILPISVATERHFVKSGSYAYVSFALPDMHPGQVFQVEEPVMAVDSQIRSSANALTRDGKNVSFELSMMVGMPITVSIAGEDLRTSDYDLELLGLKAETQDIAEPALREALGRVLAQERTKTGFFRHLVRKCFPLKQNALLFYPRLEAAGGANGITLYVQNGFVLVEDVTYSLP